MLCFVILVFYFQYAKIKQLFCIYPQKNIYLQT